MEDNRCSDPNNYLRGEIRPVRQTDGAVCKHDKSLDLFHTREWSQDNFDKFYKTQHMLSAHVFNMSRFEHIKGDLKCLPFLSCTKNPQSGLFSNVFEVTVPEKHLYGYDPARICTCWLGAGQNTATHPQKLSKHLHLAVKEFKEHPSDVSANYNAKAAFTLESTTLGILSVHNHDHLVRPIAAFTRSENQSESQFTLFYLLRFTHTSAPA
jgi:hypothetical protein